MTTTDQSTAAARLDRLPILRFHKRLFALVSGGLFIDNFDIYIAGAVLAVLLQSNWSSLELNATFISATYTGMLMGTVLAGIAADRYGRKLTFQLNLAIFGLASIACALAPNIHFLIVARFVCGVGLGAELVVGYSTLAEFTPPHKRGKWQTLMSMVSSFGLLASTLLSFFLIPAFGWQVMFWIPGLAALYILWLRKAIPESPRWLEVRGRRAEADAILREIESEALAQGIALPAPQPSRQRPVEMLASRKFLKPLILGTVLQVVMFTALYGLVNWIPTFLTKQGMSLNQSLGQTAFMTLGGPAGAFIAQALTDRLGRRRSIIFGSVIAAALAVAFGQVASPLAATLVGFATFTATFFLLATIQALYLPELFPTEVRMRCNAICLGIARVSSIIAPFGIVMLFERGGFSSVVTAIAVLFLLQAAVILFFGIETSKRSIDEIIDDLDASVASAGNRITSMR